MPIVTLTTDFGLRDFYLGILKGGLLRANDSLKIVDITHEIEPYDIVKAAFSVKNAYPNFPEGSIHVLSVNNFYGEKPRFIVAAHDGHYFIAPDNGVLSMVFPDNVKDIYEIAFPDQDNFPLKKVISDAVAHLAGGQPINEIGDLVHDMEERIFFNPVTGENLIRGTVIHIDHYENVIVNIKRSLFDEIGRGRPFQLFFKRFDPLKEIKRHYYDVPVGETLCLFNSSGFLEIAINMGKAASMLGLKTEDTIQIEFKEV